jgi:ureidoacrylate peracid hydrolase
MELRAKTALIIIDMQNGFCHEDGFMNKIGLDWTTSRDAIGPVKQLAAAARAADLPVFYTRYTLNPDYSDAGLITEIFPEIMEAKGMVRDTWDAEIVPELAPQPGDRVIDKTRYSAFYDTDLEQQLRDLKTEALIVCGVTTNVCVESTVRDAFFRDIRVIVPSDATAAVTPELHEGALEDFRYSFGPVVTVAELEEAMQAMTTSVAG